MLSHVTIEKKHSEYCEFVKEIVTEIKIVFLDGPLAGKEIIHELKGEYNERR